MIDLGPFSILETEKTTTANLPNEPAFKDRTCIISFKFASEAERQELQWSIIEFLHNWCIFIFYLSSLQDGSKETYGFIGLPNPIHVEVDKENFVFTDESAEKSCSVGSWGLLRQSMQMLKQALVEARHEGRLPSDTSRTVLLPLYLPT
jgi:hypothetical protein